MLEADHVVSAVPSKGLNMFRQCVVYIGSVISVVYMKHTLVVELFIIVSINS